MQGGEKQRSPPYGTHVFLYNKEQLPLFLKKREKMDFGISAIISAAIAAVASGASTAASVGATSSLNKKNRKWQEKMYEISLENNRQDAETAYQRQKENAQFAFDLGQQQEQNHFQNLMQSARAAGVNPGMALGAGGTQGTSTTATAPQSAPAQAGSPQTFSPQIMDLSQAAKNIADAKLAEATAKKEEGLTEKIEDEKQAIQQGIAESQKRMEKMDSDIDLNKLNGAWQTIQNNIAGATQQTQIDISKWNLKNLKQNFYNEIERLNQSDREITIKEEMKDSMVKLQNAQCRLTLLQANGQKINNDKELQGMKSSLRILEETANKIAADAKNSEEFHERWEREMKNTEKQTEVQEFAAKHKGIWQSFVQAYNNLW